MQLKHLSLEKLFLIVFTICISLLFASTIQVYPGNKFYYLLFTVVSNGMLIYGFRKNRVFFESFLSLFLWLGLWLKLSVRLTFMEGAYKESVGSFDYTSASYDYSLALVSVALIGFSFSYAIREYFYPSYAMDLKHRQFENLYEFYKKYRKLILTVFTLLLILITFSNFYFGIYQRGSIPRIELPRLISSAVKWLILFGLGSFSSLLLDFEFKITKNPYLVAALCFFESCLTSISLLSRAMILNSSSYLIGAKQRIHDLKTQSKNSFQIVSLCIFVFLFALSILIVGHIRFDKFKIDTVENKSSLSNAISKSSIKTLVADRFVGIEGVFAIVSYKDKGWNLWREAWDEVYYDHGTSFFDLKIITSPYVAEHIDLSNHHFISLPGIVAFLFYPGSWLFLFLGTIFVGLLGGFTDIVSYKFGGNNLIFSALIGQVVASRFSNFGYVPNQTYLLFSSIFLNIFIFYFLNKIIKKFC